VVRIRVYVGSDINSIMSDYGSCRISSANDGEEQISSLPIRHNQERQSDAKKAKTSSQGLNRAVLVSGGEGPDQIGVKISFKGRF
jgi:hypothetical protein